MDTRNCNLPTQKQRPCKHRQLQTNRTPRLDLQNSGAYRRRQTNADDKPTNWWKKTRAPKRSTLDIIPLIPNGIQHRKTNRRILIDHSKASDSIDREILWTILYESGMPRRYIRELPQWRNGAKLRSKIDGILGTAIIKNRGVFHGIPLSAQLFEIYFGAMFNDYDNALPEEIKHTQSGRVERNEFEVRKLTN